MKIGEYEVVAVSNNEAKVGCQSVTREQVKDVLRAMDEWKPAPKFEVGDFVKVIGHNRCTDQIAAVGKYGKIIEKKIFYEWEVEFAEKLTWGEGSSHTSLFNSVHLEKVD